MKMITMDFETYEKELEEERMQGEKVAMIHVLNILSGQKEVLKQIEHPAHQKEASYNDLLSELNMLVNGLTQR